jgi:hypothetical protein
LPSSVILNADDGATPRARKLPPCLSGMSLDAVDVSELGAGSRRIFGTQVTGGPRIHASNQAFMAFSEA